MARNIQSLFKITSNVLKSINTSQICINGSRTLYSGSALGMDGYEKTRENIRTQFFNMEDKFREKMRSYLDKESKNMVFTEDLKNMLHLVKNEPDDMELLKNMMVKFNAQNKELRFGSYVFGPVVMRTYYYLDRVDEALAAFLNPELKGFFDQIASYQILMDLLYNHQRYADIREVFEIVIANQPLYEKSMYPRNLVTLVLGGCYKENSAESFEYAMDLWQKLKSKSVMPMRRASTFFAGLALNQGKPDIAMEVIFNIPRNTYVTVLNLKVIGLAELGRLDDIFAMLRASLSYDSPEGLKHNYTKEAIGKIEKAIEKAGMNETDGIVRAVEQLKQNGQITDTSLDELITMEISGYRPGEQGPRNDNTERRNNFQSNYRDGYQQKNRGEYQSKNRDDFQSRDRQVRRPFKQFNNYNERPGLKDLV